MYRKITIFSSLLCALILSSCIKEDVSQCPSPSGLRFQFSYTINEQYKDLLQEQVGDIYVYIFDQSSDKLFDIIQLEPADIARGYIDVDLPNGTYTASVWAGSSGDMMQSGFSDVEVIDNATSTFTPKAIIGSTTLESFRMLLISTPHSRAIEGEIAPSMEQFDHLFFSAASNIEVSQSKSQTVGFDFMKNTKILKLKITGLNHLWSYTPSSTEQPLKIFVTGSNERHRYDNTVCSGSRKVHYEPSYTTLTDTEMTIDIKMMALNIDRFAADHVLLYILNTVTGDDMVPPLDVINDLILKAKDSQGNYIWANQDAIDRADEFSVEISILYDLNVRVTVNGFEVVDTTPDIGRP